MMWLLPGASKSATPPCHPVSYPPLGDVPYNQSLNVLCGDVTAQQTSKEYSSSNQISSRSTYSMQSAPRARAVQVRPNVQPADVGVAGLRRKRGARELAEGRAAVGGGGGGREERRWVQPVAHDEQVAVAQAQRWQIEALVGLS